MRELGIRCQVYSSDPFENEEILKVAGNAAEGVFYPSFFIIRGAEGELLTFIHDYKNKYGREPESNAGLAYNGIQILLEAGLLPGAMLRNKDLHFICKYVYIKTENNKTPFRHNTPPSNILKIVQLNIH